MKKVNVISIPISTGPYTQFIENILRYARAKQSSYTCLANTHTLVEAYKDKNFASVLHNADVVTADGMPLTWALQIFYGIKQDRVAGVDLMGSLLDRACRENLSVYFYGGTEDILYQARKFFEVKYPSLKIAGTYSPPFRSLSKNEENAVIQNINRSGASLVFVVLGCPKQEKWMSSMQGRVQATMIGVGAALPVMIGLYKRAPRWIREAGFEWLFRLFQEPKRLFKRYAVTNSIFIFIFLRELFFPRPVKKVESLPTIFRSAKSKMAPYE